jgi:hypothetical protein
VIVEPTYHGYRIEVEAVAADGRWKCRQPRDGPPWIAIRNADKRLARLAVG